MHYSRLRRPDSPLQLHSASETQVQPGARLQAPRRSLLAVDVQSGKAAARRSDAHAAAINRLLPLSETAVASGDDDGAVHLWDTRQARRAACTHPCAPA